MKYSRYEVSSRCMRPPSDFWRTKAYVCSLLPFRCGPAQDSIPTSWQLVGIFPPLSPPFWPSLFVSASHAAVRRSSFHLTATIWRVSLSSCSLILLAEPLSISPSLFSTPRLLASLSSIPQPRAPPRPVSLLAMHSRAGTCCQPCLSNCDESGP